MGHVGVCQGRERPPRAGHRHPAGGRQRAADSGAAKPGVDGRDGVCSVGKSEFERWVAVQWGLVAAVAAVHGAGDGGERAVPRLLYGARGVMGGAAPRGAGPAFRAVDAGAAARQRLLQRHRLHSLELQVRRGASGRAALKHTLFRRHGAPAPPGLRRQRLRGVYALPQGRLAIRIHRAT